MQLEFTSKKDLENLFIFPVIFNNNGNTTIKLLFECMDYINSTNHTLQIVFKKMPLLPFSFMTFKSLYQFLDPQDINNIKSFLDSIYSTSKLYESTMHKMTIKHFTNSDHSFELQRYFVLPKIQVSQKENNNIIHLEINKNKLESYVIIPSSMGTITKKIYTIIRTTFSDIELYNNSYINEQYINQSINVSNYEMKQILSFVITQDANNTDHLYTYNTIDKSTILIPSVSTQQKNTEITTSGKKRFNFNINVTCNVFNGFEMKDYSQFFIQNGIELQAVGNKNVDFLINKQSK
jgi:hypothetical protein